jgi:hypothetical protein
MPLFAFSGRELVADTADGADEGAVGLELFSEVTDMYVY